MAANKFLKRIEVQGDLHVINSDPLTVLAILFSTLIHDADHRGIGNGRLIQEDAEIAAKYGNKSPAEQNSLDTAWDLLMHDFKFHELKECLFHSDEDLQHFRQVIVNSVLATDIFDAGLNQSRKDRWEKAFCPSPGQYGLSKKEQNELRVTVIIEHIIQASDVSHTMQHWHIYRKWNQQLFEEMSCAYMAGRMEKDPSLFWYKG
jgi:3'5'-cyclic nucleotide phosphodiesterase